MVIIAKDQVREPLHCIVPIYNPWRWKSRYKHAERALKHFSDSGVVVTLVEVGFNRRDLVFADSGLDGTLAGCQLNGGEFRHKYIGLHSTSELWHKEASVNIGVQNLPMSWQQACYIDADIIFARPNWVGETIQKLQHYKFVQMFSQARDLTPGYELLSQEYGHSHGPSFTHAWRSGHLNIPPSVLADIELIKGDIVALNKHFLQLQRDVAAAYPPNIWPGLCWAFTRQAFEEVGGLFDVAVWGGADYEMAHAMIHQAKLRCDPALHPNYRNLLFEWENRCKVHIRKNIGTVDGVVFHQWHGKKKNRKYVEKRNLMSQTKFDPLRFLKRDYQGLWQLHDDGSDQYIDFRDSMRKISAERNEDTNEV